MSESPGTNATPTPAPPTPAPVATGVASASEDPGLAAAKGIVDKGAPWKAGMKWPVVLTEGIVLAVAGAVTWLAPGIGGKAVLELLGVILLVTSVLSVWQLLRDRVAPRRIATVAFRAGVGVSVGLIVVAGALIAQDSDTATVALAVVLGIGLILYGLSAVAAALLRREPGSRFPIVALVIGAATLLMGVLLVANGRNGIDSLKSTFTLLGILLLIVGLALCGYAFVLRSKDQAEPAD